MVETPAQPARRDEALEELRTLGTMHEERFDDLIEDLAETLDAPVAFLTLIDAERQWTKSSVGPVARESRLDAFSSLFILGSEPIVIPDAAADGRFASSPLVTQQPKLRFFAGVPIASRSGQILGAVCIGDPLVRSFDDRQLAILKGYARRVTEAVNARPMALVAYATEDFEWVQTLLGQAQSLVQSGLFDLWSSRRVSVGERRDWRLKDSLQRSRTVVVLVSEAFLRSDFVERDAFRLLLQVREVEGVQTIPLLLEPCGWKDAELLAGRPPRWQEEQPLAGASEAKLERLFSELGTELAAAVHDFGRGPPQGESYEVSAPRRPVGEAREISPDLFLSHASEDALVVRELAARLREAGLDVWLDVDELKPGDNWMEKLEEALQKSSSFAVYVGRVGVERWINREVRVALDRNVSDPQFRVIPILGPEAAPERLPTFLSQHQWLDLRGGNHEPAKIKELVGALLERPAEAVSLLPPGEAPFRGLLAFDVGHAHLFFGRDREAEELLERLRVAPFLAVVGDSGSGKSSLVRAGLIPALHRGRFASPGSQSWKTLTIRPGSQPFRELCNALPILAGPTEPAERLRIRKECQAHLADGVDGIRACIGALAPSGVRTLIVVDQFEELFTQGSEPSVRRRFIDSLLAAGDTSGDRPVHTLITLRADFFSECFEHPDLPEVISNNQYPTRAIARDQLIEVIEKPAAMAGLRLEPGLAEAILHDLGEETASLALLEHTLLKLWDMRESDTLTHRSYDRIGRIQGALEHHAEDVFTALDDAQQLQARNILMHLVEPGPGHDMINRRPIARTELLGPDDASEGTLQHLVEKHLVTIRGSTDEAEGGEIVEVAHEALLRAWTRLRGWLDEDREFLLWRQRTNAAFNTWEEAGRDQDDLLRGGPLAEARRWLDLRGEDLTEAGRTFIRDSIALFRRRRRRARAVVALIAVLAVVAVIFAHLARRETGRARTRVLVEQARSLQEDRLDAALLLALEVDRRGAELDARRLLSEGLESSPALERLLHGHTDDVREVAWSADGRTLASASGREPYLLVWNLAVEPPVSRPLQGVGAPLWGVAFSPEGRVLAAGADGGEILVWDLDGPTDEPSRLSDPVDSPRAFYTVRFSPDGKTLGAIRSDSSVQLWDVETGLPIERLEDQAEQYLRSLVWSPEGDRLAAGGMDKVLFRWDARTGRSIGPPLAGHDEGLMGVDWSDDGGLLASGGLDGQIHFWSAATGESQREPWDSRVGVIGSLAWGSDPDRLAVGGAGGRIQLWDSRTSRPLARPATGQAGDLLSVAWSPEGGRLASGNGPTVVLWNMDVTTRLGAPVLLDGQQLLDLAVSPDGAFLAAAGKDPVSQNFGVRVWSAADGALRNVVPDGDQRTEAFAWTPENTLVLATANQTMQRREPLSGELLGERSGAGSGRARVVAWSPDGSTLAAAWRGGGVTFRGWEPEAGPVEGDSAADARILVLAWSPDGRTLAAGTSDGEVRLWDAATGALRPMALTGHDGRIRSLAFSPNGETLASGGHDETVRLWDPATGEPLGEPLTGHRLAVTRLAWSPDGQTLASADDRRIVLWDIASGMSWAGPLEGHERGRSGAEGGEERADPGITGLVFNPDGRTLTSVGGDGTLRHWDVDPGSWRLRACRIAGRSLTTEEWSRYLPYERHRASCPEYEIHAMGGNRP